MDQAKIEQLSAAVRGGAFNAVREVMEAHIARLTSVDDIDRTLDPEALKIEIEARYKAKATLTAIVQEITGYGAQERSDNPLLRSMR